MDVKHAPSCPGGEVPDGLHPWDGQPSIPKCGHPGPQAQHIPLLGPVVPPRREPEEHQLCLGLCTRLRFYPHKWPSHEYSLFFSLKKAVLKKPARKRVYASWVLEETRWVIEARVYIWRSPNREQCCLCNLGRRVRTLLDGYLQRR